MLVYFAILQKKEELDYKQILIKLIKIALSWGIGFAITWISKWILVDILYNKGTIKVAIIQSLFRTTSYGMSGKSSILQALNDNIYYLGEDVFIFIMISMLTYMLIPIKMHEFSLKKGIAYILIGTLPIIWIIAITNHSAEHAFFVYRNLYITITGFMLLLYSQTKYK